MEYCGYKGGIAFPINRDNDALMDFFVPTNDALMDFFVPRNDGLIKITEA